MYQRYSSLQQAQLQSQVCPDTQHIYLEVYGQGRLDGLRRSLALQLHHKFRLLGQLPATPHPLAAGVVLAAEDAELMSTALAYFAQALEQGADFVYSNAVYGYNGGTACWRAAGHYANAPCAAVSWPLLAAVRAKAKRPDDAAELLALAAEAAQNRVHIPQALVCLRRELAPGDLFSPGAKRAVLLTHEFNMSGAPIVLVSAVPLLRSMGYEVMALGPKNEDALPLFVQAGATCVVHAACRQPCALWSLALYADFVLANTVVEAEAVNALNGAPVPVLWWLHDAFAGYPAIAHRMPHTLCPNVGVYTVGLHALAALHSVRPDFEAGQLVYGLPDYAAESFGHFDISFAGGRPLFVNVGSLERRKGQDIMVQAIRLLPPALRSQAAFLFVGGALDRSILASVLDACEQMPDTVFYRQRLSRDEIKSLMTQCTCVVCSSRDDPMPTFITEGLIFGRPNIVSEHTGTAGLVTEGVDGFIYRGDSAQALADALAHAITHPQQLAAMGPACRALYERSFSQQAFANTLAAAVQRLTAAGPQGAPEG